MKNWEEFLAQEAKEPYFIELMEKVDNAREVGAVYPSKEDLFSCFKLCPYEETKVVIIGQDPYHGAGQAHGLSFSVKPGQKIPPSLRNIYKELKTDLDIEAPNHGYLADWAKQGVLMMNTSWSVEAGKAGSHKKLGWSQFTNRVLEELNDFEQPLVFILWGNHAINVAKNVNNPKHLLIKGVHPSPLAARGGFFGSKPFSETNTFLESKGRGAIQWQLNEIAD
ncbi:uracil-DNA glycosylase [Isobaculum melis]|uniref:Uracil-DNA glycosylase n=1 Tax=Isobaculum melis TaxID=142588 RepID=A0A1H9QTW2_9LACT|nr:uracil-DNA glycosylase [Isobaculum melis]SER63906.1 Uracil-DNA glycosylase [Isobaculum melis]